MVRSCYTENALEIKNAEVRSIEMPRILFFAILFGLFSITLLLAACSAPYQFHGTRVEPPRAAADFALTNPEGQTVRLSDYRGQLVLLFFGYTHCPDVCPTTLAQFKRVRAQLGSPAERVRFVFITVDPERDTPELLRTYLAGFDPTFIGLTGATADLEAVWKSYGVYREKRAVGSALDYSMDHTARIYAVDTRGNLRMTWLLDTDTAELLQDVRHLLEENSP